MQFAQTVHVIISPTPKDVKSRACMAHMQRIDENEAVDPSKARFKKDDGQGGWAMFVRKDNNIFTGHTKVRRLLT